MNLQPADDLLCDCLGRTPDSELRIRLRSLSSQEWIDLEDKAEHHGVASLLYHKLKDSPDIPADIRDSLRKRYFLNARKNMLLYDELGIVISSFQADGITVIPLKGVYLAETIYQNIALREIGDADLLVHATDLGRVKDRLIHLDYTSRQYWIEAESELTHALPPYSKKNAVNLDIHWALENSNCTYKVDTGGLWQRAHSTSIAGIEVLGLSPEDLFLHLCLHVSYHHHFVMGLRGLCDLAQTLQFYGATLDFDALIARIQEWGVEKPVFLAMKLMNHVLGAEIPSQLANALHPADFSPHMVDWALEQLFPVPEKHEVVTSIMAQFWSASTLLSKIRSLVKVFFPSKSFMATRFPVPPDSIRIYFYYPTRWGYLIRKYARTVWGLFLRRSSAVSPIKKEANRNALTEWMEVRDPRML
jgi:hypothetical protein